MKEDPAHKLLCSFFVLFCFVQQVFIECLANKGSMPTDPEEMVVNKTGIVSALTEPNRQLMSG